MNKSSNPIQEVIDNPFFALHAAVANAIDSNKNAWHWEASRNKLGIIYVIRFNGEARNTIILSIVDSSKENHTSGDHGVFVKAEAKDVNGAFLRRLAIAKDYRSICEFIEKYGV